MTKTKVDYKKVLKRDVIDLLNIHGVSGNERAVRNHIKPILEELMDKVEVDFYGNLLGELKVGSGLGASVLLSAHMDTVKGVLKDRELIVGGDYIYSDFGALGGDDRAGIAIILSVLKNIKNTNFEGKIKVAFSREEEIGCVGASKINPDWFNDVELAIVVDRRGNRDVVVGCGGAFCSDNTGMFFESVGELIGQNWNCIEGGISDATVFSLHNVNSVNLSAGYYNEHTAKEHLSLHDMTDTTMYILEALNVIDLNFTTFGDVPNTNKWVKDTWGKYLYGGATYENNYGSERDMYRYGNGYDYEQYYEDEFVWAQEEDSNGDGDVYVYEYGDSIVISQKDNEINLTRTAFRSLLKQLDNYSI